MVKRIAILSGAVITMLFVLLVSRRDAKERYEFNLPKGTEGVVFLELPKRCEDVRFLEPPPDTIKSLSLVRIGEDRILALLIEKPLAEETSIKISLTEGKPKEEKKEPKERLFDYLILTSEDFARDEVLKRFVGHKEKMGLRVRVKTVEEIIRSAGDSQLQVADRIRKYLIEEWMRSHFVYLLIIGTGEPYPDVVNLRRFGLDFVFYPNSKSRFYLGSCVKEQPNTAVPLNKATIVLSREDLRADEDGRTAFLYLNGAEAGEAVLLLYRAENGVLKCVKKFERFGFSAGFNSMRIEGFSVKRGDVAALYVLSGSILGVPVEGFGAHCIEGESENIVLSDAKPLNLVPAFQVECFRTPEVRAGTIPMKILYPLGTYSAFARAYFLDSHFHDCPTDYYYSALEGEFDRDGDGYSGEALGMVAHFDEKTGFFTIESGDGALPLPNVAVGRIPFDPASEYENVKSVLERIIGFEPASANETRINALVAVEALAPDTKFENLPQLIKKEMPSISGLRSLFAEERYGGELAEYAGGYEAVVKLDEIKKNPFEAADRLVSLWREAKPQIALVLSHGNCDRLGNLLPLRRLDISDGIEAPFLKYVDEIPADANTVVFLLGCNAAQPERYYLGFRRSAKGIRHNWEERKIVAETIFKSGVIGVVAPTHSSWFTHKWQTYSDGGMVTLLLIAIDEFTQGIPLGLALRNAQQRYAQLFGCDYTDAANIAGLVLYGDPSISLKRDSIAILTDELPDGVVGEVYKTRFEGVGGTKIYHWKLIDGELPRGVSLSESGELSGTPSEDGEFVFKVRMSDSGQRKCERKFSIRIELRKPIIEKGEDVSVNVVEGACAYETSNAKIKTAHLVNLDADSWKLDRFSLDGRGLRSDSGFSVRASAEYMHPLLLLSDNCALSFNYESEMERGDSFAVCEVQIESGKWDVVWFTTGDGRIVAPSEPLIPQKMTTAVPLKRFAGRVVRIRFRYVSNEEYSTKPKRGIKISEITVRGVLSELRFERSCFTETPPKIESSTESNYIVAVDAHGKKFSSQALGFIMRKETK